MEKGIGRNTVSHIKTKGSGGKDEFNVVPMCMSCHRQFENLSTELKQQFLPLAKELTEKFYGKDKEKEISDPKSAS